MIKIVIFLALFLLSSSDGRHSVQEEKKPTAIDELNKSLDKLKHEIYSNSGDDGDAVVVRSIQKDK